MADTETRTTWLYPREDSFPVLTVAQTRSAEQAAFQTIDSFELMKAAGERSAARILDDLRHCELQPAQVLVLAGPGNNGGDALVVACTLARAGLNVALMDLAPPDSGSKDRQKARKMADSVAMTTIDPKQPEIHQTAWIVDGLLGIGITRAADGLIAQWIEQVNRNPNCRKVYSLDAPSGLNCDTGFAQGPAIQADVTLSYIACKTGLLSSAGKDLSGSVRVEPLNCQAFLPDNCLQAPSDQQHIARLPLRQHVHHKGTHGSVGIVGGCTGMVGAALLAARSAILCGAGRVAFCLLADQKHAPLLDFEYPELMNKSLDETLAFASVLAAGTGMGLSAQAEVTLAQVLESRLPIVLDADALNLLATGSNAMNQAMAARLRNGDQTVMTPHPLEAARLLNTSTEWVQNNRLEAAQKLARQFKAIVVLKGAGSLTVSETRSEINLTGSALLATAGSGDVLTGCIAALLAQGLPPFEAASTGVWLHGLAADPLPGETHALEIGGASILIGRINRQLNHFLHKRTRGDC